MKLPRRVIKANTIQQDVDASCFRGPKGNESKHNKTAKRTSSRRLRRFLRRIVKDWLDSE